jgi:hypothetical protein
MRTPKATARARKVLATILDFAKSFFGSWWTDTNPSRKAGDLLVAVLGIVVASMVAAVVFIGFGIWEIRAPIYASTARLFVNEAVLNRSLIEADIATTYSRLTPLGATALYVRAIDLDRNMRGPIVASLSVPEEAARIETLRGEADSALIGEGALDLASFRSIIEGRPHWFTPTILIVPIPPQFRVAKTGLVVIFTKDDLTTDQRVQIEVRALSWSDRIAAGRR